MMRYQNNMMPAANRPAPRGQTGWEREISNQAGAAIPDYAAGPMEVLPGGAVRRPAMPADNDRGRAADGRLHMQNDLPAEVVEAPTTVGEAYLGSLKAILSKNIGNYIVATFLVGTQNMVSWEGILYDVGNDYLTIYQASRDRYIVSDYYSLKFMEFYDTERREMCNAVLEQSGWNGGGQ